MNQMYRVIFNQRLGIWQCVSEIAKAKGKSKTLNISVLAIAISLSGQSTAEVFGGGIKYDRDNYQVTAPTTIFGNGTVLKTNVLTVDGLPLSIDTKGNVTATKEVKVQDGGHISVDSEGVIESHNLLVGAKTSKTISSVVLKGKSKINVEDKISIGQMDNSHGLLSASNTNTEIFAKNIVIAEGVGSSGQFVLHDRAKLKTRKSAPNSQEEGNLIIGERGKGEFIVDNATVEIKGDTTIAKEGSSNGKLSLTRSHYTVNDLNVGSSGEATLQVNNSQLDANTIVAGFDQKSKANILIDNSTVKVNKVISIGISGKVKTTVTNGSTVVGENLYLSSSISPSQQKGIIEGELIIKNGSNVDIVNTIGIGNTGTGRVEVAGKLSAINVGREIQIGGWLPNDVNVSDSPQRYGNGSLEVKNGATVTTRTVVVGNQGKGKLVVDNATVKVGNIERKNTAQNSLVSLTDATVQLIHNQDKLFDGFTDKNQIEIKGKSIFDTQNYDIKVFDKAKLSGNGSLIKQGKGILTLNTDSKAYKGETHINEGTLKLAGNYTFAKDEILAIAVENQDQYGKLETTGKLDISQGKIHIKAFNIIQTLASDSGQNASTLWKEIVKARELTGKFKDFSVVGKSGQTITNGTDLLHLDYHHNAIDLKVGPAPKPDVPAPKPDVPAPKPDMPAPKPDVPAPKPDIPAPKPDIPAPKPDVPAPKPDVPAPKPDMPAPKPDMPNKKTGVFTQAVEKHNNISALSLAKGLDKAIANPTEQNKRLALALNLGIDGLSQTQISQAVSQLQPLLEGNTNRIIADGSAYALQIIKDQAKTNKSHLWVNAIGSKGKHKIGVMGLSGYQEKHSGTIIGLQTLLGNTSVGLTVSHLRSDIDSKGITKHHVESKTTQAFIYAKHQAAQNTHFYGHFGLGRSDIEGKRHISLLANTSANAQYKAKILQTGVGIDHQIGNVNHNITPFVDIDYTKVVSDAYQEKGAGVYNLSVNKDIYKNVTGTLGVKANYTFGKFNLNAKLAGGVQGGDKQGKVQASLANGSVEFTTRGHQISKAFGLAGVSVGYQLAPSTKLSLSYQGQWHKKYNNQSGIFGLDIQF